MVDELLDMKSAAMSGFLAKNFGMAIVASLAKTKITGIKNYIVINRCDVSADWSSP